MNENGQFAFKKAVKHEAKLRAALIGPAGSGKTLTGLQLASSIAEVLGGRVAVIDSEHGSASKYADLFDFDTLELTSFNPKNYSEAFRAAEAAGYVVCLTDSLSHAWMGKDGALETVDAIAKRERSGNSFAAWRTVTPLHNEMVETILASTLHFIATMRSKMDYVQEKDEKGKTVIRKVGLQPIQRDGLEYEFDVVADMDLDNTLIVGKTRCPALTGQMFTKLDSRPHIGGRVAAILLEWLKGAPAPAKPPSAEAAVLPALIGQFDALNYTQAQRDTLLAQFAGRLELLQQKLAYRIDKNRKANGKE